MNIDNNYDPTAKEEVIYKFLMPFYEVVVSKQLFLFFPL